MMQFGSILLVVCITVSCSYGSPAVFRFSQENSNSDASGKGFLWEPKHKQAQDSTCGYSGCNPGKVGMLNVHLVPHTHDDVGWLKTVDQYYYGARDDIQHAGVQYILDSVIEMLLQNPDRRFIYVEIAYFYRWWNEQTEGTKDQVKMLVQNGRLEFILGGWCMNDEAGTHYNAIIDQHTLGFKFLMDNFGECARPHIGWQIDPFGHSREQASLFAQFGFDGLFFGRLDFQDKNTRLKEKTMEMVWMGSQNLGEQGSLFTGVNYNGYGPPGGFCFQCNDPPIMDDPRLHDYNVDDRVKAFLKAANDQAGHYTTNHIMMTMGSDFQYENANENFKNLDKLIKYVNMQQAHGSKVNAIYSTPGCYLYAMNQLNQTYTSKADDFFPYASRNHTFWTGYFTSRPALKGYVRDLNNFLQVVKQMQVLARLGDQEGSDTKVDTLRQAMGVVQHHDGVSGTEKQAVAYDYAERLANGVIQAQEVVVSAFDKLLPKSESTPAPKQQFCNHLNVSYCPVTEKSSMFTVTAYNPIGRPVDWWVRVPVASDKPMAVTSPDGHSISAELVPLTKATMSVPGHNGSIATHELVFMASQIPPLGFSTYFVKQTAKDTEKIVEEKLKLVASAGADASIENEHLKLDFDGRTGLLKKMTNKAAGMSLPVQQALLYYYAMAGNNSKDIFQASGAYAFRPNGTDAVPIASSVIMEVWNGTNVQEVRQVYGGWASQVVRLYAGAKYAEVEYTVGPIPIQDGNGREVINRFMTPLDTKKTFYTDSNGREMLERVRDYRPTWKLNQTEPVAGNYYPVNSRIYIQDEDKKVQLTVLNDRSQGGASIRDGHLELMVHRRLLHDDSFGAGEPLNETGISGKGLVVRGKHYVFLESIDASSALHRDLGERLYMAPQLTFAEPTEDLDTYKQKYNMQWSALKMALPPNVHLLTLDQWEGGSVLLRLEHFYEKDEDPNLSKPTKVALKGLFAPFEIAAVQELTLGGDRPLETATRLEWNIQNIGRTHGAMKDFVTPVDAATLTVNLQPMQIRTFKITLTTN